MNFFGDIEFIKKLFNTKIKKIIRISVTLKYFLEVSYDLIMKFFIRGTNFKNRNINVFTKPCLYDLGIKLSKLVKYTTKGRFPKHRCGKFIVFSTNFNV